MDAAAIAIPIPVQPVEPPQPAPGKDAPAEDEDRSTDFASALEQQIAQTAAVGANIAHLKLPVTDTDARTDDTSDARGAHDPATPDGLIAMMSAPLLAQTPQPTAAVQTRPAGETANVITAARGDGSTVIEHARSGEDRLPAPNTKPLDVLAAADAQHAAHGTEREAASAPLPLLADAPAAPPPALPQALSTPAHAAAPAASHVERRIDARVGTADWNDGLARQVTVMVKDGEHTAQLRLDPPDLGPLEVRLSMARNQDGVAHAQFASPHAAVRDALEAALPQLRAVLADSGITLGQASVGEGFVRDDARQAQQSSGTSSSSGRSNEGIGAIAAPRAVVRHGLVDTFA